MKKRALLIYLAGVVLALLLGFNNWQKHVKSLNRPLNYGDVAIVSGLSLFSWCSVCAWVLVELGEADFWNKPVFEQGQKI